MQGQSRFIQSSVGFPEGSERLRWDAGFETYMPFAGKGYKTVSTRVLMYYIVLKDVEKDREGRVVRELARRCSLEGSGSERCGPEGDSFRKGELAVEMELDPLLRNGVDEDAEGVELAWEKMIKEIEEKLAESTTVVVRGCTSGMRLRFSKGSMGLQFGDLGQRCQWVDGVLYAADQDLPESQGIHKTTSLQRFIDLVQDTTTCGNFLDGKDLNPSTPTWATPLLHSSIAWNHTMHVRFTKAPRKKKEPILKVEERGPHVIRSSTWTSQGWRLITHSGFVTFPHHDCCGMGTYVVGNAGAKIWAIMRPKRDRCPADLEELSSVLRTSTTLSEDGTYPGSDVVTICLEEGDVMFQPPGVMHCVYTPVPSIFSGGYFYNYQTMHLTRAVLSMSTLDDPNSLTNDERPGFIRTLCRMLIALRYRCEPRIIRKRSLISLILIILDRAKHTKHRPNPKDTSELANEERGEMAFAADCAKALLKFMNMTVDGARKFVCSQGPYYSGGDQEITIPVSPNGLPDPVFPDMSGTM
ncbi:hypothetical protein J3R82DRAFT_9218 [Butyriboletus roseoflavus]|nr:hypothetical protein J3R82DRAFT_9218 [Butyriboletus roseoflavus]